MGGSVFLVAFIFAATPLPDDVAFHTDGHHEVQSIKTYISLYTGKFALTVFVLYSARRSEEAINSALGGGLAGSAASDPDNHWIVISDDEVDGSRAC